MPLAIPTILLEAVRNPVVAVGLPLTLGWASGFPTAKVVREPWYQVRAYIEDVDHTLTRRRT